LFNLPAWSAVSTGNLAHACVLPVEVASVVIAVDHDLQKANGKRPGQDAADAATERWQAEGRKVWHALPVRAGSDFNDVLCERTGARHD
jgi:hypothetical protein